MPAVETVIDLALAEDLAYGDLTSESLFPSSKPVEARIVSRQPAVISGIEVVKRIFKRIDPEIVCTSLINNGETLDGGDSSSSIMILNGPVIPILKGERLALNFLQHLSGIATLTSRFVKAIEGTNTKITHTRKTIPALRALEIQAVVHGGGVPHRFSLSHAVLIKDNHIQAAGGILEAVEKVKLSIGHTLKSIEVECDTLQQVEEALVSGADILLLDNMPLAVLKKAVKLVQGRAILEASGGITLENVRQIAETGIDIISTSQITLSAPAVDIGLDFQVLPWGQ